VGKVGRERERRRGKSVVGEGVEGYCKCHGQTRREQEREGKMRLIVNCRMRNKTLSYLQYHESGERED